MSKQLIDPKDKTGFMNLASDGENTTVIAAQAMTGKQIESYLEQFGAIFPISVETHNVEVKNGQASYVDVKGNKKIISREKAKAYREKQAKQGTLNQEHGSVR